MITNRFLPYRALKSSIIGLFVLLIFVPSSYCQEDYDYYSQCVNQFRCGLISNLSYPFWVAEPDGVRSKLCGLEGFNLRCREGDLPVIVIENQDFLVTSVNQPQNEMEITPMELWMNTCPADNTYNNFSLNNILFGYTQDFALRFSNLSLFYNCSNISDSVSSNQRFLCSGQDAFYGYDGLRGGWMEETSKCRIRIEVPVEKMFLGEGGLNTDLQRAIGEGFSISYKYNESCDVCKRSGGICGTNVTIPNPDFTCLCPDHPYPVSCPTPPENNNCSTCETSGGRCGFENNEFVCFCTDSSRPDSCHSGRASVKLKVLIGAMGAVGTLLLNGFLCLLISSYSRNKRRLFAPRKNQDFEAFLEKHGPLAVKRYSHSQVKKMTNSFKVKLGKGGYGSVYKGTISEGRLVAVKMLNESKEDGAGFLNEVAAISRTSHVNVVTLLGFCLDGRKRALIYEFMPNGSLDKFICLKTDMHLGWETIHQIAMGIAQGLEYLHRGCNTRIVHFDIKPHNVLLDENLTPKISDFGLAKLCARKESKVSMLEARGTIGYIAPEVVFRHFGQVSSKSDVYSYGMMILEIAGGRNKDNQHAEENNSSEMYFPSSIYKSLELENKDEGISEEEGEIVRKLKLVGLWCIQTNPSDRPTMSKVIEMLQASIQTLDIPPKPFLSSPTPQFPLYSSTASTD